MTMCEKDDRPVHQKSCFFIASKVVVLSLDIWVLSKAFEYLLQNIYTMLDLVYYKCNALIVCNSIRW